MTVRDLISILDAQVITQGDLDTEIKTARKRLGWLLPTTVPVLKMLLWRYGRATPPHPKMCVQQD